MKFSVAAISALLSTAAFAAPVAEVEERDAAGVSMLAASTPEVTIVNMKRVCNSANTQCVWTFGINQNNGVPQKQCSFTVNGANAADTNSSGNICGVWTISSGWSGQFGPGNGFTTLAMIIYPAYTDKQLAGGKVVTPNQSYPPQNLP